MLMRYVRKSWYCAWTTYTNWLMSSKILVFGFVFMFIFVYFIKPMNDLSHQLNTPINVFEPYVAIVNDRYALPLIVLGFMVLVSDFPRLNDFALFSIFRSGRMSWLLGQIVFIFMAGLTYIGFILASSMICVMNNAYSLNAWSLVQKQINLQSEQASILRGMFPFAAIDNSVLRQSRPFEAVVHGIVLLLLFIVVVGCVQLLFALIQKKVISVFVNISACAVGLVLLIVDIGAKWAFPISNAVFGWHYHDTLNYVLYPIGYSYLYFVTLIAVLVLLLWCIAKNCSFYITGGTE